MVATLTARIERPPPFGIAQRLGDVRSRPGWEPVAEYVTQIFGQVERLEGPVAPERRSLGSPCEAAARVKALAREAGADLVGVTSVQPYHQVDGYDEPLPFAVVLGMAMALEEIRQAPGVRAGVEVMRVYHALSETAIHLAEHLRSLGWQARAHHPVSDLQGPRQLLYVAMAVDAGLAELGRLGFAISPELGPLFRLGAVTTDLPLAADRARSFGVPQFCELCTACLRACPGGAIAGEKSWVRGVYKWKVDSERCLPHFAEHLGCSVCLAACPYSLPEARATLVAKHWAITGQDPP